MSNQALESDSPVIVYIDIKSPYAYLAVAFTRELEQELSIEFDWRPFVLDIPSYLGSASLDKSGEVVEQNRSAEQWAGVKYAYYDCRRYASMRGITIRGTVKIWNTMLVSTAMLWAKQHSYQALHQFIDLVYAPFWKRELDIDDLTVIKNLLDKVGANGGDFQDWADTEGFAMNSQLQDDAFAAGVYGVPTYVVDKQLYFGREHLPRVRWHLSDQSTAAPDIAYLLPSDSSFKKPAPLSTSQQISIGVEDTLDCLLAISELKNLLDQHGLSARWVKIKSKDFFELPAEEDQSRSAMHTRFRGGNEKRNFERYSPAGITSNRVAEAIQQELNKLKITLSSTGPEDVIHPALPGVVVKIDEHLFIGRQHVPYITQLLDR